MIGILQNEGAGTLYASDEALQLDDVYVLNDMTHESLEKVADEMDKLMSNNIGMLVGIAVIIYFITMFLLTKVIVDNSSRSISYMKVFGYRKREISRLYIKSITITVVATLILTLPLVLLFIKWFWIFVIADYSGNIMILYDIPSIAISLIFGLITYAIVAFLDVRHINKVNMSEALKVSE